MEHIQEHRSSEEKRRRIHIIRMAHLLSPALHYQSPVLPDVRGSAEHCSDTTHNKECICATLVECAVASEGLTQASVNGGHTTAAPHTHASVHTFLVSA